MKAVVLNRVALILAFAGIYVSGVLSIAELFGTKIPCGARMGCEIVAAHPSSHALGIPNAYIGFAAYVVLAILAFVRLTLPSATHLTTIFGYGMSAVGTLASLYLTFISVTQIKATCDWCLTSTAIMILLLIVHATIWQNQDQKQEGGAPFAGVMLAVLALGSTLGLAVQGSAMYDEARKGGLNTIKNIDIATILPEGAHIYGNPEAPVTIVEFGDLFCPQCQVEFTKLQQFVGAHRNEVRYVFRHFPLVNMQGHELAATAAVAAEVASEKGRFWEFIGAVYAKEHGSIKDINALLEIVQAQGLDPKATLERLPKEDDPAFKRLMRDMADANKIGVSATPTFFILAPNVPPLASNAAALYTDLKRPEYRKYIKYE